MPLSQEQLRGVVQTSFQVQELKHGFTLPRAVGAQIADELPFDVSQEKITRAIGRMDFKPHVYEGAQDTIKSLFNSGDEVVIWTQGDPRTQLHKITTSGIADIRKSLPKSERSRFVVHANEDKFAQLGDLARAKIESGAERVIIVDDKAHNVERIKDSIPDELRDRVIPVWINQGRSRDKVPEGYTLESFSQKFSTIHDIREIAKLKEEGQSTAWFFDFDHTLVDSQSARAQAFDQLAQYLASKQIISVLPPITIDGVRLNGNVRNVEELVSGMSGGLVVRVDADNASCVVKHNPDHPEKIAREINGYRRLADSPLAGKMLHPIHSSIEDAVHVLPHFDGVQMRDGLRKGIIELSEAENVLKELLVLKAGWWGSQEKMPSSFDSLSMQRTEWADTQHQMHVAIKELSVATGVPIPDIWMLPIVHRGNEYPSLISTVGKVADMLKVPPPYTVLAHGDATGGNILINPQTKEWKLLDAEWTGQTDPAEAMVRMIKQVSTTTVTAESSIETDGKTLQIDIDGEDSDVHALQNLGLSTTRYFGNIMSDPEFQDRTGTYLAGSYLRELALTTRRNKSDLVPFVILEAVKAISHKK